MSQTKQSDNRKAPAAPKPSTSGKTADPRNASLGNASPAPPANTAAPPADQATVLGISTTKSIEPRCFEFAGVSSAGPGLTVRLTARLSLVAVRKRPDSFTRIVITSYPSHCSSDIAKGSAVDHTIVLLLTGAPLLLRSCRFYICCQSRTSVRHARSKMPAAIESTLDIQAREISIVLKPQANWSRGLMRKFITDR
jgi:hypothetical protein